jgi:hypothetical protein
MKYYSVHEAQPTIERCVPIFKAFKNHIKSRGYTDFRIAIGDSIYWLEDEDAVLIVPKEVFNAIRKS